MAIFFFVVGLEIKYELVSGELRGPAHPRSVRRHGGAGRGLPGPQRGRARGAPARACRWPPTSPSRCVVDPGLPAVGPRRVVATYQSGVQASLAGVAMGLLTPAKHLLDQRTARELVRERVPDQLDATELRRYRFLLGETVPVAEAAGTGPAPVKQFRGVADLRTRQRRHRAPRRRGWRGTVVTGDRGRPAGSARQQVRRRGGDVLAGRTVADRAAPGGHGAADHGRAGRRRRRGLHRDRSRPPARGLRTAAPRSRSCRDGAATSR
jgi:hypothetical protein